MQIALDNECLLSLVNYEHEIVLVIPSPAMTFNRGQLNSA